MIKRLYIYYTEHNLNINKLQEKSTCNTAES